MFLLPASMKKIRSLECSKHYTAIFSDVQGQLTLELVVVSGRNLNSFKLSCMSLLLARMRMIESKMKVLGPIWPNFELVRDV